MQPTNKHLRISYVHEVNNNKTQLLSMSHTFKQHQMHCSTLNYNTHCKMTYGCSNLFLGNDWVTPSRILLLVISPSFSHFPHVSTILVSMHKFTPPHPCMNGKKGSSSSFIIPVSTYVTCMGSLLSRAMKQMLLPCVGGGSYG